MNQRTIHLAMIYASVSFVLVGAMLYTFAPAGRDTAGLMLITSGLSMLGAKASNGFGKPLGGMVEAMTRKKEKEGELDGHEH
jgi:hypothetical protein